MTPDVSIRDLHNARIDGLEIFAVHYACESWFEAKDRPTGVSCISLADVVGGGEMTFSVTDRKEEAELYILKSFYDFLRRHADARLIHWNMNSSDFGFQALENRFIYLGGLSPVQHPAERRYDLDDLIAGRYGKGYADHPRFINITKINEYRTRYFLSGADEAKRYADGEHGDIKRSVTEKAKILAFLTKHVLDGTLQTKGSGPYLQFAGAQIDSVRVVLELGERFLDVSRQLRLRHGGRPTLVIGDEYDAQDLFHSLLRVFFKDVRPEEWTPSYAGSNKRIDFLLPEYRLAVELKNSRPSMTAKIVGDELTIDIANYKNHHSVSHLVCLVFDSSGHLANPRGIERDLSSFSDGLSTTVRILDR
jgi:DpnII restriction endonuclease